MSHKRGTNQYRIIQKPFTCTEKVLVTLLITLCIGIYIERTRPATISPCPDDGCRVYIASPIEYSDIHPSNADIIAYIAKTWESESNDTILQALQVAKYESGYRIDAKGYNCRYDGVSMACKPQDRPKAWSVDCGIFQHNVLGTVCPAMTWRENIEKAYALFKRRGWNPWVVAKKLGYVK